MLEGIARVLIVGAGFGGTAPRTWPYAGSEDASFRAARRAKEPLTNPWKASNPLDILATVAVDIGLRASIGLAIEYPELMTRRVVEEEALDLGAYIRSIRSPTSFPNLSRTPCSSEQGQQV